MFEELIKKPVTDSDVLSLFRDEVIAGRMVAKVNELLSVHDVGEAASIYMCQSTYDTFRKYVSKSLLFGAHCEVQRVIFQGVCARFLLHPVIVRSKINGIEIGSER